MFGGERPSSTNSDRQAVLLLANTVRPLEAMSVLISSRRFQTPSGFGVPSFMTVSESTGRGADRVLKRTIHGGCGLSDAGYAFRSRCEILNAPPLSSRHNMQYAGGELQRDLLAFATARAPAVGSGPLDERRRRPDAGRLRRGRIRGLCRRQRHGVRGRRRPDRPKPDMRTRTTSRRWLMSGGLPTRNDFGWTSRSMRPALRRASWCSSATGRRSDRRRASARPWDSPGAVDRRGGDAARSILAYARVLHRIFDCAL
jgi:hypothetical protein